MEENPYAPFNLNYIVRSTLGGIAASIPAWILARIAMRAVAVIGGDTPSFSISGTLNILKYAVLMGGAWGMVFGVLLPFFKKPIQVNSFRLGVFLALILLLMSIVSGEEVMALNLGWAVPIFLLVPLAYGLTLGWVTSRLIPDY
jgi:hypothetical protein